LNKDDDMDVVLTSVLGNGQSLDGGAMFGNVPRGLWSRWTTPDEEGRIKLACRAMLVEIGERRILCETGIGDFFGQKMRQRFGVEGEGHVLLNNLNSLGYQEGEITDVILSHLHFDHAGGLLSSIDAGPFRLLFPQAKIFVGKVAWERARNPHSRDRASFIPELNSLLANCDRLVIIEGEHSPQLPPQISFRYSHGHTPGHMHTVIKGREKRVIFVGDLIPGKHWIHLPITMGYDRFPEKLIDEKECLLEEWEKGEDYLFFTHDVDISLCQVAREKGKFTLQNPQKELRSFIL